ncbi:sigma-70 family RNA polymerase sigma factor [Paenibacillus piri]|uniref:Sigma-70 family RNA polymerase sigma factor n=1 Tax=Paenibacillus piri TaxID=2547395 RepID=A0A4R5KWK7_9BACL|nr:sigma-70 family RNA polymerase sigma factor [Paenibacillus piri]TDG00394.1 sigma-70 family RNA polymerase sigma factor [Paenibacillus piri]
MPDSSIQEWIQKMNNGNEEAFRVIYEQSKGHVYSTVSLLLSNKQDVYDVVNEVYAELLRSLPKYDFQKPFRPWLTGLTIRQVNNWNRKLWRRFRLYERSHNLATNDPIPDSADVVLLNEHRSELLQLVQMLPYKQKMVIVLRYYHDHTFEEISELLEIPVGTVKSRHHTALAKLRKHASYSISKDEGGFTSCPSKIN